MLAFVVIQRHCQWHSERQCTAYNCDFIEENKKTQLSIQAVNGKGKWEKKILWNISKELSHYRLLHEISGEISTEYFYNVLVDSSIIFSFFLKILVQPPYWNNWLLMPYRLEDLEWCKQGIIFPTIFFTWLSVFQEKKKKGTFGFLDFLFLLQYLFIKF